MRDASQPAGSREAAAESSPRPPRFGEATTRRQQARAAGLHPDYWYAVAHDPAVPHGQVVEVMFQGRSIALFRAADGTLNAVENRCAHRQLKLSLGEVNGCRLTCAYHGWSYDGDGRLAAVPHHLSGRPLPKLAIASFPIRERYGLIWIFPGAKDRAEATPMPEIPEIEGPDAWACIPLDFTFEAHHSMIIENICDLTHAHLHRSYQPFSEPRLARCVSEGDSVSLAYDLQVGNGRVSRHFLDRSVAFNHMTLTFQYPYQRSDTGGRIRHWCFLTPLDERRTRLFFLFYFEGFKIPLSAVSIPRWLMRPFLALSKRLLLRPILEQDRFAVEAEQEAYERNPTAPAIEMNPAIAEFQKLIVRRWSEHLQRRDTPHAVGESGAG